MREWEFTEALVKRRDSLTQTGFKSYCLFGMSGNEIRLAEELNQMYTDCLCMPFLRTMHRSRNGQRFTEQDILLKGYVFLYTPVGRDAASIKIARTAFRMLGTGDDDIAETELMGDDRRYAEWVLQNGGVIGVSKALREGDKVRIVDGPLLSVEGYIREYSKKNRNCRVEIEMTGNRISAWLPFEWVEGKEDTGQYAPS